jgi:hypothetical protein
VENILNEKLTNKAMERPDRTKIPITDANTYLKWDSNQVVVDYEKYAKDLDAYIDYLIDTIDKVIALNNLKNVKL